MKLEAKEKVQGKNPRQLRAMGLLPVSVYGKDVNLNVVIDSHEFINAYKKDKNTEFEIAFAGKSYSTITKNVQFNYATSEVQSVEFAVK